jgi:hypothetical protein
MPWFYGGLKVQPAIIALFQQADCQPAFVRVAQALHAAGSLEPALRFGTANYPYLL